MCNGGQLVCVFWQLLAAPLATVVMSNERCFDSGVAGSWTPLLI